MRELKRLADKVDGGWVRQSDGSLCPFPIRPLRSPSTDHDGGWPDAVRKWFHAVTGIDGTDIDFKISRPSSRSSYSKRVLATHPATDDTPTRATRARTATSSAAHASRSISMLSLAAADTAHAIEHAANQVVNVARLGSLHDEPFTESDASAVGHLNDALAQLHHAVLDAKASVPGLQSGTRSIGKHSIHQRVFAHDSPATAVDLQESSSMSTSDGADEVLRVVAARCEHNDVQRILSPDSPMSRYAVMWAVEEALSIGSTKVQQTHKNRFAKQLCLFHLAHPSSSAVSFLKHYVRGVAIDVLTELDMLKVRS